MHLMQIFHNCTCKRSLHGKIISFDVDIPFAEKATSPFEFSFIESDLNVKGKILPKKKIRFFFSKIVFAHS